VTYGAPVVPLRPGEQFLLSSGVEGRGIDAQNFGHAFNAGAAWSAANHAKYAPFLVQGTLLIVKLFTSCSTSSGNLDVAILGSDGVKIVSSGSTPMGTANDLQEFDITDTVLAPGRYFFGMAVDNTSAFMVFASTSNEAEINAMGVWEEASAFPLPSTATFAKSTTSFRAPWIGAAARALVA
jgi:hypothetical protein